jgi:hypothetical protein
LRAVFALAALQLGFIYLGSNRGRIIIDTMTLSPVNVWFPVKCIRSIHSKGRGSGRTGQLSKTSSRALTSIGTLAALKLRVVRRLSIGSRVVVDTVSLSPVANVRILVPDIKSSGRDG